MTPSSWRARFVLALARLLRVPSAQPRRPVYPPSALVAPPPAMPNATLTLDSKHPFLRFRAAVAIQHSGGSVDLAPGQAFQIALAAIHQRAEDVTARYPLTRCDLVRSTLAARLVERKAATAGVSAWATCTGVEVDANDLAVVADHEQARRNLQAVRWQDELREYQIRSYESLLANPLHGSAWWLASNQNAEKIMQLPDIANAFRQLRDHLAADAAEHAPAPDTAGSLVDELLHGSEPPERNLILDILSRLHSNYGRGDLSERNQRLRTPAPTGAAED
jgi:hypothetical protein